MGSEVVRPIFWSVAEGKAKRGSSKLLNKKVSPGKILTEQTDRVNGLAARGLPFGQEAVPGKV